MDDIEFLVCDLALLWRRAFNARTKDLGISTIERRIIINIERNPGITQIDLANLIEIEPQNLIKSLDKLTELNWLEKRNDSNDRRIKRLHLTSACKPTIKKIQAIGDSIRPLIMDHMTAKDTKFLLNQLQKMRLKLEKYLDQR